MYHIVLVYTPNLFISHLLINLDDNEYTGATPSYGKGVQIYKHTYLYVYFESEEDSLYEL